MPASTASPNAAPHEATGTRTGMPSTSAFIWHQSGLFAPPPTERRLSTGRPAARATSTLWRRANAVPSRSARTRAALLVARLSPKNTPRASVSHRGERSPAMYGRNSTPPLPAGTWYFAVKVLADHPLGNSPTEDLPAGAVHPPGGPRGSQPPAGGAGALPGPGATSALHFDTTRAAPLRAETGAAAAVSRRAHRSRPQVHFLPNRSGIAFEGVAPEATVRLYDVAGRLIRELRADGAGNLVWDLRAATGAPIARGVVLYRVDPTSGASHRGRIVVTP